MHFPPLSVENYCLKISRLLLFQRALSIYKKRSKLELYFPRYCILFRWSLSRGYVRASEMRIISIPTPAPRRKIELARNEEHNKGLETHLAKLIWNCDSFSKLLNILGKYSEFIWNI